MASPQQASSKVTLSTHLLTRNHTAFYSQRTTSRTTRRNKSGAQKRDRPCSNTIRPAPGLSPDPQHQGTGGPESCRHLGTARATGQDLKEKTNANTPNHRPLEKVTGKEGQQASFHPWVQAESPTGACPGDFSPTGPDRRGFLPPPPR